MARLLWVYEQLIKNKRLYNSVLMEIRYIPDEDVNYYFRAVDVVVLPYKKIYQSGVLLMAMSHSKPVIVSDLPGMTEIIKDGVNGAVFKTCDKSALARSIIETLSSKSKMKQYASGAYNTTIKRHSWTLVGRLTTEAYKAAVKLRG